MANNVSPSHGHERIVVPFRVTSSQHYDQIEWELTHGKAYPRKRGKPGQPADMLVSGREGAIKCQNQTQGILYFSEEPRRSEDLSHVVFQVGVSKEPDKLALLMPKLKDRNAVLDLDFEVELEPNLSVGGDNQAGQAFGQVMDQLSGTMLPGAFGASSVVAALRPRARGICQCELEFPHPFIWHPFFPHGCLQDDDKPSLDLPGMENHWTADDRESGYVLDTLKEEGSLLPIELRKFNPDTRKYRVTNEVMKFEVTDIAHPEILDPRPEQGSHPHLAYRMRSKRAILGKLKDEVACYLNAQRDPKLAKPPEFPAQNEVVTFPVFYRTANSVTLDLKLTTPDREGQPKVLYEGRVEIDGEKVRLKFRIGGLSTKAALSLEWKLVSGPERITKADSPFKKEGSMTPAFSAGQVWEAEFELVADPVTEATEKSIEVAGQGLGQVMLSVEKPGWSAKNIQVSKESHPEVYKVLETLGGDIEIKIPHYYGDLIKKAGKEPQSPLAGEEVLYPKVKLSCDMGTFECLTREQCTSQGRAKIMAQGKGGGGTVVLEAEPWDLLPATEKEASAPYAALREFDTHLSAQDLEVPNRSHCIGAMEKECERYQARFILDFIEKDAATLDSESTDRDQMRNYLVTVLSEAKSYPYILQRYRPLVQRALNDTVTAYFGLVLDTFFALLSLLSLAAKLWNKAMKSIRKRVVKTYVAEAAGEAIEAETRALKEAAEELMSSKTAAEQTLRGARDEARDKMAQYLLDKLKLQRVIPKVKQALSQARKQHKAILQAMRGIQSRVAAGEMSEEAAQRALRVYRSRLAEVVRRHNQIRDLSIRLTRQTLRQGASAQALKSQADDIAAEIARIAGQLAENKASQRSASLQIFNRVKGEIDQALNQGMRSVSEWLKIFFQRVKDLPTLADVTSPLMEKATGAMNLSYHGKRAYVPLIRDEDFDVSDLKEGDEYIKKSFRQIIRDKKVQKGLSRSQGALERVGEQFLDHLAGSFGHVVDLAADLKKSPSSQSAERKLRDFTGRLVSLVGKEHQALAQSDSYYGYGFSNLFPGQWVRQKLALSNTFRDQINCLEAWVGLVGWVARIVGIISVLMGAIPLGVGLLVGADVVDAFKSLFVVWWTGLAEYLSKHRSLQLAVLYGVGVAAWLDEKRPVDLLERLEYFNSEAAYKEDFEKIGLLERLSGIDSNVVWRAYEVAQKVHNELTQFLGSWWGGPAESGAGAGIGVSASLGSGGGDLGVGAAGVLEPDQDLAGDQ